MIIDVTEVNFRREVSEAELPVLLEFYAAWCGKCAMMRGSCASVKKAIS